MIHVIAVITVKPGTREQFLEAFRANVPNVLAEAGCIEYGPAVDVDFGHPVQAKLGPDTVAVVEKWASMDHLKAHMTAPHMAAYAAKVKDLLVERRIHILGPA